MAILWKDGYRGYYWVDAFTEMILAIIFIHVPLTMPGDVSDADGPPEQLSLSCIPMLKRSLARLKRSFHYYWMHSLLLLLTMSGPISKLSHIRPIERYEALT